MKRSVVRGIAVAVVLVGLALVARQWWLVRGTEEILEVWIRGPGLDLFLEDEWVGREEVRLRFDREYASAHRCPSAVQGLELGPTMELWLPGATILDEELWGFAGQLDRRSGLGRGTAVHHALLEAPDGTLDSVVFIRRVTHSGAKELSYYAVLRGRGEGGRVLEALDHKLVSETPSWFDRMTGAQTQRLELEVGLAPFPESVDIDLTERSFGVDRLPVP